jgi:hypothetical protein
MHRKDASFLFFNGLEGQQDLARLDIIHTHLSGLATNMGNAWRGDLDIAGLNVSNQRIKGANI